MKQQSMVLLFVVIYFTTAQISSNQIKVNPKISSTISQILKLYSDPRICTTLEKARTSCPINYQPACGVYVNSSGTQIKQSYLNRCFACKSSNVKYVYNGLCSSYPAKSSFCIPHPNLSYYCFNIYNPVCGYYNKNTYCTSYPCQATFSNPCQACNNQKIDYYIPGVCYRKIIVDIFRERLTIPFKIPVPPPPDPPPI